MLERGEHALGVQTLDEGARVGGDEQRVRAEAPCAADDHRVRRVVSDVHDGRQVPVDPGALEHAADPARLQLGEREVVALAELPGGERRGESGAEPHDLAALGVHRDQERPPGARAGALGQRAREAPRLLVARDVPREEDDAADPCLTEESLDRLVSLGLRALEADEQELAQVGLERGETHGLERRIRAAASGGEDEEASGDEPPQRAAPPAPDRRDSARRRPA